MDKNILKELNKVELEENYSDLLKELKILKGKLFLMKSLEVSNAGVGALSIAEAINLMYKYNISKESVLILAFGMLNIITADYNVDILNGLNDKIDTKNGDKEDFEKEFKVRKFLRSKNGLYQI